MEVPMPRALIAFLALLVLGAAPAPAQTTAKPAEAAAAKTGRDTLKSRLSDKATDEQRVDNCNVAVERRGPKPRPGCAERTAEAPPKQERR
jgi:hypothetical protein